MIKIILTLTALLVLFAAGGASAAPTVTLDPVFAARHFKNTSGKKEPVRIHIKLSDASNLLNFSIKIVYDHRLRILEYHVNDATWNYVQNGYYKHNSAAGSRILYMGGAADNPVSGDVLLGWLVVEHNGGLDHTPVHTYFNVELAGETASGFDNFVTSTGTVVDSSVVFTGAEFLLFVPNHFDTNACQGDFDGNYDVDSTDYARFYAAYPSVYPASNYDPAADLDADGEVDIDDKARFDEDYNQTLPCPVPIDWPPIWNNHVITTIHDEIGGDIYPGPDTQEAGHVSVADGTNYTFRILPVPNYSVKDITVDYISVLADSTKTGANYSYTFTNVTTDHILNVIFSSECVGDINGDGTVGTADMFLLRTAYGSSESDPNWNPRADINQDGTVGTADMFLLRENYGSSCP